MDMRRFGLSLLVTACLHCTIVAGEPVAEVRPSTSNAPRFVTVVGTGVIRFRPDTVRISLSLSSKAESAVAARELNFARLRQATDNDVERLTGTAAKLIDRLAQRRLIPDSVQFVTKDWEAMQLQAIARAKSDAMANAKALFSDTNSGQLSITSMSVEPVPSLSSPAREAAEFVADNSNSSSGNWELSRKVRMVLEF